MRATVRGDGPVFVDVVDDRGERVRSVPAATLADAVRLRDAVNRVLRRQVEDAADTAVTEAYTALARRRVTA